jgi:hypothetical protein
MLAFNRVIVVSLWKNFASHSIFGTARSVEAKKGTNNDAKRREWNMVISWGNFVFLRELHSTEATGHLGLQKRTPWLMIRENQNNSCLFDFFI